MLACLKFWFVECPRVFFSRISVRVIVSLLLLSSVVLVIQSRGEEHHHDQDQVPTAVLDAVKAVLKRVAPHGEVLEDHPDRFRFGDRLISLKLYSAWPNGYIPPEPRIKRLPCADGFMLELRWFPHTWTGYVSGIYSPGRYFPREYSLEYLAHYKLPDNKGFIELRWNYGASTNQRTLEEIQSIVGAVSSLDQEPIAEMRQHEKLAKAHERLKIVIHKHHPDVTWQVLDRTLICTFKTMEFDIHSIDEQWNVAPEAHRETGPQQDGFVIRLNMIDRPLRCQSRPVYGRSYGPYWRRYSVVYDETSDPCRLDILYGVNTDKKLLEEVTDALDEMFGMPARF